MKYSIVAFFIFIFSVSMALLAGIFHSVRQTNANITSAYAITDPIIGDCNEDGALDVADVPAIRQHILTNHPSPPTSCDANQDLQFDIADLTCLHLLLDSLACQPLPNENAIVGTNLSFVADWSSNYPFVDAFKASRSWIPQNAQNWDTGEAHLLDLDAFGWVRSLPATDTITTSYRFVGTLMFREIEDHYPSGVYIVLYDGEGTIEYDFAASATRFGQMMPAESQRQHPSNNWVFSPDGKEVVYLFDAQKDAIRSTPGRDEIIVTPDSNGIYLKITETDPNNTGDYIRNIRVIMPGFEDSYQSQLFHPHFLAKIAPYHELRFMDWMQTNESTQKEWVNRPQLAQAHYSTKQGVPLEIMVALANRTGTDPWFNMPHMATDGYIYQFANQTLHSLYPGQKVYVEYSNEVWNRYFRHGDWVEDAGIQEWSNPAVPSYTKRLNWYGKRSTEMCEIWKTVWGDQSDRVVCVVGAQTVNTWIGEQALDCPLWEDAPCYEQKIDAIAIAPYFGQYLGHLSNQPVVQSWTNQPDGGLDLLFTELITGGIVPNSPPNGAVAYTIAKMQAYESVADDRGIALVSYEGGQHLVDVSGLENNDDVISLFTEANRDPRIGVAYAPLLNEWANMNGKQFLHYLNVEKPGDSGSWGALEHLHTDSSPKFSALMDFSAQESSPPLTTPITVALPALSMPELFTVTSNAGINLPVSYLPNGYNIASLAFTIQFDERWLQLDLNDTDDDGVFDGVEMHTPADFSVWMTQTISGTTRSLLLLVVNEQQPMQPLFASELMRLQFAPIMPAQPLSTTISFETTPIFARNVGLSIAGSGTNSTIHLSPSTNPLTDHIYLPLLHK